jgi:hypothetical protein
VVPSHSAVLPGYIAIGIRKNHMDMTKFEDADDPGFKAVVGELHRWVKESTRLENTSSPQSGTGSSQRCSASGEAEGRTSEQRALTITQGGSTFAGPTIVSGGSLFQGNYIGRDGGIF